MSVAEASLFFTLPLLSLFFLFSGITRWSSFFPFSIEMLISRRKAGLSGIVSLPNLFFLFSLLLFVNSVTAAPLQLRGSSGPTFCNVPLKANSYYRNVCLGLLDPQTGSKIQTLPQPGVASIGNNLLRWQTSKDMDGILENQLVDKSEIHCDQ